MLGEIVINSPQACADIPPILLSFHEEESFLKGVLWALGRITDAGINGIESSFEVVTRALDHKDPLVRGLALHAVPKFRIDEVAERVRGMVGDEGRCRIYKNHELVAKKVGDIAKMVLGNR